MVQAGCDRCDFTGFLIAEGAGPSFARRCGCATQPRGEADLLAIGVPRRYLHCTLDNFQATSKFTRDALRVAHAFVDAFPANERGLLFMGPCGTGKTHLAVAILRELVMQRGGEGVFADYQDLLKKIQQTYQRDPDGVREDEVLQPILEAEILVLDDLGSRRPTPWAEDTLGHLLGVRYNEQRLTLLTTNLLDLEPDDEHGSAAHPDDRRSRPPGDRLLLADRVTEPVRSRIHEMCQSVTLEGEDWRRRGRS